ncbi:DoxX family protein [Euhalothece natronophila Z-M001]|uniref:DoxX family protein n=1 Tax=Euhalothece natronophila Z-M001 TaxID=522448 RepID=A0A5B8NKL4_9CHRO|nr:DoxX family protein [Euhalothece natronophila]QDZ38649.1 DoxX family protein [Euhalothece natronophila Z-M001]
MLQKILNLSTKLFRSNLSANYWSQAAWTILRVIVGVMMVHNGLDKLSDVENFATAYVEFIGLPFPIFFTYVAAYTELIGAPLVAIGFLTRPAALGLVGTMAVAMYHHILVAGLSIPYLELSAIYASCFLFFLINGAGLFSVDNFISGWLSSQFLSLEQQPEQIRQDAPQVTDKSEESVMSN